MGHVPEQTFITVVRGVLVEEFENVRQEPYLPETGRYPDFVADGPLGVEYVFEVENDFESVWDAVGKAQAAAADRRAPRVIVPEGHVEEPERTMIEQRSGVPIIEIGV